MHQMTKEAIRKLQSQTKHSLTIDDLDLIEGLDAIAKEVTTTTSKEHRLLREPFSLCGVDFYPLTVAKSLWFAEKCKEWQIVAGDEDALMLWVLTLPLTPECFDGFSNSRDAIKATKRLSRKLHCSDTELSGVYARCLGVDPDAEAGEPSTVDYGGLIAVLVKEYGGSPNRWLYEESVELISALLASYSDRNNAEQKQSSGKAVAPAPSKRLAALTNFRNKLATIQEIWEKTDGE